MENKESGIPITTVLFLIFLVLKLTHVIDWPWVWVFSPLWIPIAIVLGIMILGAAYIWFFKKY